MIQRRLRLIAPTWKQGGHKGARQFLHIQRSPVRQFASHIKATLNNFFISSLWYLSRGDIFGCGLQPN